MNPHETRRVIPFGVALLFFVFNPGCATKKYVQSNVQPLEVHLGKVEEKATTNTNDIRDLDRKTESGIATAQSKAEEAARSASTADLDAKSANALAQKGVDQALQVKQDLANADNFQPTTTETILFGFNRANLTDKDKQTLDQLADTVQTLKHYVIQVQGFTDTTGPKQYNLDLSQRRAEAVIRYLTLEKKIPLVRIYMAGYGEASPVAPNDSRKGREENRRVAITVMVAQMTATANNEQTTSSAALAK
jgi:OmpA-OmpF porin, OOP family